MKKTILLFLIFAQHAYSQTSINQFLKEVFTVMQTKNIESYKKIMPSENYLKQKYWDQKDREGITFPDRAKVSIDSFMHVEYKKLEPEFTEQYNKVIKNNSKTNIDWAQTVLDSTRSDSIIENQTTIYNSKIYFRNTDGMRFFIMNVMNTENYKGQFFLNEIYVPYLNYGATNRLITKSLKPTYIKNCIVEISALHASMPNGKTPADYCEYQYNKITEETDGVDKIKNGFIGIYYNNGKKPVQFPAEQK